MGTDMRVLIDMDGTIADWGAQWDALLEAYGASPRIPRHADQRSFDLRAGLSFDEKRTVDTVMNDPRFYASLKPITGAVSALRRMKREGHDVRLVTSPWLSHETCATDKLRWAARYLGGSWPARVILTTDKTLVRGDILIDDKPSITGAADPEWEHVLFTQPYNVDIKGKRRLTHWAEWEGILNG